MNAAASIHRERLDQLARAADPDRADLLTEWGPAPEVLASLVEEASRLTMVAADEAAAMSGMLVALADRLNEPLAQSRARRALARALSYLGQYDGALHACHEAVALALAAGRTDEAGRARLASMHALTEAGRLGDAIAAGEAARDSFLQIGEPALAAKADVNLGIVYQRQDEPGRAVDCFDRARPALRDDHLTLGHLDNNRGEALLALNDFSGAESAFASALKAFEDAGAELTAAIAEGNLADLAVRQGRLATALEYFERSRRRFESSHSPNHLARLLAEQADAKAVLGLTDDALHDYKEALRELDRQGMPLEAARARAGLGRALLRRGRLAEAETALAAAATGFAELGNATARAKVDLIRAELAAANGRTGEARAMTLRALASLEGRPADSMLGRHVLASLAMQSGDLDLADAELAAALSFARRLDLAPVLADLWQARGRLCRQRGRREAAVAAYVSAAEQVERVRGTLQAERFRAAFLGDRSSLYEELVDSLLDGGREGAAVDDAFTAAERGKSRVLLDQLSGALDFEPAMDDPQERDLALQARRLRGELNALYSRLADDELHGSLQAWQEALHKRERDLTDVESRLDSVRGGAGLYARPATLPAVRASIDPDTVLVEYFMIGEEILAFIVNGSGVRVYRRLAERSTIVDLLERLQFQIDRALRPGGESTRRAARLLEDARAVLGDLHRCILQPFADSVREARRLVIVPHGLLHVLPFHALYDGQRHLIEMHEVCTAPSASLHVDLAARPAGPRSAGALVVGVADDSAPRIAQEARQVGEMLGRRAATMLVGHEATVDRVMEAAPGSSLIHLACHGRFSAAHPDSSGLRLSDRWLTVRDICSLRLDARLVTLSACETGLNLVRAGDELTGLFRAVLAAGAGGVLASLWRVHDESTLEFMRDFYGRWDTIENGTLALPAAARQTQQELMDRRPHPAFWAPFMLIGGAS